MSRIQLRNEMMYQATMCMARQMMGVGLITEDEYAQVNRIFIGIYRPLIGSLSAGKG